jgi:hypothetical protein
MATTGPISGFTGLIAGSGYANGTYNNVALSGGSGSGASANITVAGNAVTAAVLPNPSAHQTLDRIGKNYQMGDSLSADRGFDGVGSGSGFLVVVAALSHACENCLYGKIVPPSAGPRLFGQRYCANAAYINQDTRLFSLALLAGRAPFQNDASAITSHSWEALICQDDYQCGDGADLLTGISFSSTANSLPSTATPIPGPFGINVQTISYTFVISDANAIVEMNAAGANTLTVPPNSSVGFPIGTVLNFAQTGAGITTLTLGAGVTINSRIGLRTAGQYAKGQLYKDAINTWVASGDLQV